MNSRRMAKASQAILECVSSAIVVNLKDPRVKNVTVTGVEVSPDFRSAKVKVSVMGDEKTLALTMRGLRSARGFLQSKVAERLETRYTPVLDFVVDRGVKMSIEASSILRDLKQQEGDFTASPETEQGLNSIDSEEESASVDDDPEVRDRPLDVEEQAPSDDRTE